MLSKIKKIPHIIYTITNHPLNKKKKIKSLFKFIAWQIRTRTTKTPITYTWIHGSKVIVHKNETGFTGNIYCGLHEFTDMMYLLHATDENDTFIDIGSNIGSYTILASAVNRAKTIAYEPTPATYQKLTNNININRIEDLVTTKNTGVSNSSKKLHFTNNLNCSNHIVKDPTKYKPENLTVINTVTLNRDLLHITPTIMKIDVEGFEAEVIEGAREILSNKDLHSVIMETNGLSLAHGFSDFDTTKEMSSFGFKPYKYNPFNRELIEIIGRSHESGNTIYCKDENLAKSKIQKSKSYKINGISI